MFKLWPFCWNISIIFIEIFPCFALDQSRYTEDNKALIREAVQLWAKSTCLNFVEVTGQNPNGPFLMFYNGSGWVIA